MYNISPTNIPTKEFTVNYDIAKVKEAIKEIGDKVPPASPIGFYKNSAGTNELFGHYTFNIFKQEFTAGLISGDMAIDVEEVEPEKTKIKITAIQKSTGPLVASRIIEIQDNFLRLMSGRLTGEKTVEEMIPKSTGGCFGVILFFILISFLYYFVQ